MPRQRSFLTSRLRTASASNGRVERLAEPLPSFVHKWSGANRLYKREELRIPEKLYYAGLIPDDRSPIVAVGGTRSPTVETFCLVSEVCRRLSGQGCAIVSGGVPGVDLAAHMAALDAPQGVTYAVMANPAGRGLAGHEWSSVMVEDQVLRRGAFISEYATSAQLGSTEHRERLLQRDRIISGIADIFVAFECNVNSATVDTAYRAMAQGKTVVVVRPKRPSYRRGADVLAADSRIISVNEKDHGAAEIASRILAIVSEVRCMAG